MPLTDRPNSAPGGHRRASFKAGMGKDTRAKRADRVCSIRKNKRAEAARKRRNVCTKVNNLTGVAAAPGEASLNRPEYAPDVANLQNMKKGIFSADTATVHAATRGVRRLLSRANAPPVREVIECGLMPRLVELLSMVAQPKIMMEAAWALTNVGSTEFTPAVVEHGAVPPLVALLKHSDAELREQAAWCLGNVSGEGTDFRDALLATPGALEGILLNIRQAANPSLLRNCVWTCSNLCRGKPQPRLELIQPAVPVLLELVARETAAAVQRAARGEVDEGDALDVLVDASWALSYVTDGNDARIDAVVRANTANGVGALVALLKHPSHKVVTPALRAVGNIVTAEDPKYTEAALSKNLLAGLLPLLDHAKANVRKESCWTVSNVTAGTQDQVRAVMAAGGGALIARVLELLNEGQWDVRKEAAFAAANVCTGGTRELVAQLCSAGDALKGFCELLNVQDVKMISVALEALDGILRFDKQQVERGGYALAIEEAGGLDKIEALQEHENTAIYEKAVKLLESRFGGDGGEEEDENLAPVAGTKSFAFSAPTHNAGNFQFSM